jgi:hypothetical protein
VLGCSIASSRSPAEASTPESPPTVPNTLWSYVAETAPWVICGLETGANEAVLEHTLSPPNGAVVSAGTPVTFSTRSQAPVTFAVASSAAALSSPDIDGGPGLAQPNPEAGSQPIYTYTFTSTKASATQGTVYWQASFSNATLTACVGLEPNIRRSAVRPLTVLPAPTRAPEIGAGPGRGAEAVPAPVKAGIVQFRGFHGAQPTVKYLIRCSASCSGDTYYEALVLHHHGKARRVAKLDFGPAAVSISAETGGSQVFAHRYSGASLRLLDSLIRAGGVVEIRISVKVTDTSANVVRAQSTARLRP